MRLSERYRTALVTGARSGLGAAFAGMLVREGVRVWGTSRKPAPGAAPAGVAVLPLELADPVSVAAAWEAAEAAAGAIDLLINNAGAGLHGRSDAVPADAWEQQQALAFSGPARLARLAFAAMRRRGRGAIVNVTSLAIEFPIPFMSAYNSGKAALAALGASLADEAAGSGVTVIEFRAGDFRTDFHAVMHRGPAAPADTALARAWARLERINAAAPPPALAARDLRRALARGRGGVVRSGGFFQARVAPWGLRLLPARLLHRWRRHYFGLS